MQKSADAFRTISEVADDLKLPQHVLRFWETRFPQVKPLKRGGNRRFYRPDDVELLRAIKVLLYGDGFTIKGVQRILKERGPRVVAALALSPDRTAAQSDLRRSLAMDGGDNEPSGVTGDTGVEMMDDGVEADDDSPPTRGFVAALDSFDSLQAVLFELSECRRILASVHD